MGRVDLPTPDVTTDLMEYNNTFQFDELVLCRL